MSSVRVGINGFGRIGRYFLRQCLTRYSDIQVTTINSPGSIESASHLLKYDSVHGIFDKNVTCSKSHIQIDSHKILYSSHRDPESTSWKDVDVVLECSGRFKEKQDLQKLLKPGVQKVIVGAPAQGADWTVVYGVNHEEYQKDSHHIISNSSCTTNGVAPIAWVLNKHFGIEQGFLNTVHAYTSDQKLLDGAHKDLRRARAAGLSIIPTTTGASSAIEKILPSLKGKLKGTSIRVPTSNVSLIEFTVQCKKSTSTQDVHQIFENSINSKFKNILKLENHPLVSCDFLGSPYSAIIDAPLTKVHNNNIQVFAWYDNEAGFSHRLADMILFLKNQGF